MKNALIQIKRRKRVQQIGIGVVALGALWLSLPLLSQGFFALLSPVWNGSAVGKQIIEEDIASNFIPRYTLVAENKKLEDRVRDLSLSLSALRADMRALEREAYIATTTVPSRTILRGAVYAKPPVSPYGTFLVNVGWQSGVREGDYAYAHEDVAVGTIESVSSYHSIVSLISRPDRETSGIFETGIQVPLVGQGGGVLKALVPVGSAVEVGHLIYATDSSRPVIGVVEALEEDTGEGVLIVFIRQSVNPHEISHLLFDISSHDGA